LACAAVLLPVIAPVLRAHGLDLPARGIFVAYRLVCHQRSDRSFHVYGEQMAVCQRDVAILSGVTLLLAAYWALRGRWAFSAPRPRWPILLALPMAVDGGTQLLGLRESSWELRVLTGLLFSAGAAWFVLPQMEAGMRDFAREATSAVGAGAMTAGDGDHGAAGR
jgi:uncharacterized membrane protein